MIRKRIIITVLFIAFSLQPFSDSFSQKLSYGYLMDLGKTYISEKRYEEAIHYFNLAHVSQPFNEEPLFYVDMAKRLKEGKVEQAYEYEDGEGARPVEIYYPVGNKERDGVVRKTLDTFEVKAKKLKNRARELSEKQAMEQKMGKAVKVLDLDDELKETQPSTTVVLEIDTSFLIRGRNIERFLIITPGVLEVEQIDKDTLQVRALMSKGNTFLHVWDDNDRWTVYVKVIFSKSVYFAEEEDLLEEGMEPFVFSYSADWNSYYRGSRAGSMNRENLDFTQWAGIYGQTPYGELDYSTVFTYFKDSTEVTSYTLGLTDTQLGPLKGQNIRLFDLYKRFSRFSLPGTGVRGGNLQGNVFDKRLGYDIFWGRKRTTHGYVSPGVEETREEFIEGLKLDFWPEEDNNFSFNYVKGYGSARQDYLSDYVTSLETENVFGRARLSSEYAFDGNQSAAGLNTKVNYDNLTLRIDARNIEPDFTTIVSRPSGRGELGGRVSLDYEFAGDASISSDIDLYRDRVLFNPDDRKAVNVDWDNSLYIPVSDSAYLRSGLYYIYTPGLLSPRRNVRLTNMFSQKFGFIGGRVGSWFVSNSYQRNRMSLLSSSNYNRHGVSAGIRVPLINSLSAYLNYEYSWVEAIFSGRESHPRVLTSGLSYYRQLSRFWSGNFSLSYRDEEHTEEELSFLAGEDSLRAYLGLSYRPSPGFEFFINGGFSDIWAENPEREAYNSMDIRWGVRFDWELPFSWTPQRVVQGMVFEDLNGNKVQDPDESGLEGITIRIGKQEVTTDKEGKYRARVRAKKVSVAVGVETVPAGYVFSTSSMETLDVRNNKIYTVDFGLTTKSGIYGTVYLDTNRNNIPDEGDIFIPGAKIILDNSETMVTDPEGTYFFRNLDPGKHVIKIDINSLPLEYIPVIKVVNQIYLTEAKTNIFNVPLGKRSE